MGTVQEPQTKVTHSQSSASSAAIHVSVETEQLLLGGLLRGSAEANQVVERLTPDHFTVEAHRDIFKIISKISGLGREPSPITVSTYIGNDDLRVYLGTLVYRVADTEEAGIEHSIDALAAELDDLHYRRRISDAIDKAKSVASAAQFAISSVDLQDEVEKLIGSVKSPSHDKSFKSSGDIAMETFSHAKRIFETGEQPGFYSGFQPFDDLMGPFVGGDLIVLGGATSSGKTSLAQQLAFLAAHEHPVFVVSLEMTARQWNERYINQLTGIPTERLEMGPFSDRDFELIDRAWRDKLRHLKMQICDRNGITVAQIRSMAKRVMQETGLKLLVVDHLGFIRNQDTRKTGPDAIGELTADLKALAKELDVPVLLISHINRDASKRENYRPGLSDLYGSSAIEKDADMVIFVHRLAYWLRRKGPALNEDRESWEASMLAIDNQAELILAKRRRGHGEGIAEVYWDPNKTLFLPRR